ncbi:MAG: twin-arginine translocase subunit TatC [Gammaproteobacteria bacterium]|nr:twin-arginine translocase subunit TatC [Gammaproteobacteria bacterium]
MTDNQPDYEAEGSFFSHLLELRNRLLYALAGVFAIFLPLIVYSQELYNILAQPLLSVLPKGASMIATEVASPFLTPLRLAFIVSLVASIPWILYQAWAFVAPGLYRHERRLVIPLLASSTLLFYGGMAFAYFVVFPLVFEFFTKVAPEGVQIMTDIKAYLDFVFAMFIAFGIAFELPVAILLLTYAGVIEPESLADKRPYVLIGVFAVAMLLTPPDVISQTLLAIPMMLLFEVGLFFARRIGKRKPDDDSESLDLENEIRKFDEEIDEK